MKLQVWVTLDLWLFSFVFVLTPCALNSQRNIKWYVQVCILYDSSILKRCRLLRFFVEEDNNIHISHYSDVIMGAMASQITGVSKVYSPACSDADKWKHQNSASLAEGNSPVTPAQRASNAEYISFWWRHHVMLDIGMFNYWELHQTNTLPCIGTINNATTGILIWIRSNTMFKEPHNLVTSLCHIAL